MKSVLVFDPGDHTGWILRRSNGVITGGTLYSNKTLQNDIRDLNKLFEDTAPDVVVYETFRLYPGAAPHMAHNAFYPVQIIGVIETLAYFRAIPYLVTQAPSVKKYSGGLDDRWKNYIKYAEHSEHTKDAYLHLKFFEHFNEHKLETFLR